MLDYSLIRERALEVGFDDCGVVAAHRQDGDAAFMEQWLAQGLHGEMSYLERNREKRYDPRELVAGAKAVVVCVLQYSKCRHDYHRTIKSMLYQLDALLHPCAANASPNPLPTQQHIFCDSAPFLERRWATEAGLGFIGRNHQFFHHSLGSKVHLGELVLTEEVAHIPSMAPIAMGCPADCHRCEEACPTGALRNSVWDATQCVAYTTHHCLVCQDVCPMNAKKAKV